MQRLHTGTNDASAVFDPYYTWLGIPPARQPPNHYQLLGITDFEGNTDVISNAYEQRVRHVRTFQLGEHAAQSQKLLGELASARLCLLNPDAKAAYDHGLRGAIPSPHANYPPPATSTVVSEPPASQGPFTPVPAPLPADLSAMFPGPAAQEPPPLLMPLTSSPPVESPTSSQASPTPQLRRIRRKRPAKDNSLRKTFSIVFGGVVGCAIGWFIAFVYVPLLQDRQRQTPTPQPAITSAPQRSSSPAPKRKSRPAPAPKPPADTSPLERPSSSGANPSPSVQPASPPMPLAPMPDEPSPVSVPEPAESPSLSKLPTHVDLPPISERSFIPVMLTAVPDDLEIGFSSDLIALQSAYTFVATKTDSSQAPQWQINLQKALEVGTQEALVAELMVENNRLSFRWADDAAKLSGGQLRNCVMHLKSEDDARKIALRSPVPGESRLPPEDDKFQVTFRLEDPPPAETLRLDVELMYEDVRIEPPGGTGTTTRGKRIDFKVDEKRAVEIQITLIVQEDLSLTLQALPRLDIAPGRQLTLSKEDVDQQELRIRQALVKAQRSLAKAINEHRIASDALSRASDSATRAKFSAIVGTKNKSIAINRRSIEEMQQSLNSADSVRELVTDVRRNTLLQYRIYSESDGFRLLLVDGGYADRIAD